MKRHLSLFSLLLALALIAAACGGATTDTTAAASGETTTTVAASPDTTQPAEPSADFVGTALDAGGCDYGGKISSITAVDELTVQFELCSPDPAFVPKIAFGVFGIQPAEHLEATGGAPLDNPVGTGPYALQEWVRGDSVVYTRNENYYGQKPTHSTAVLRWATESAGRLLELQSQQVDGITFPGTEDLATIEADPNLVLLDKPEPNIFYMGFTNTFAPWDNVDVRKAVALGHRPPADRGHVLPTGLRDRFALHPLFRRERL